MSTSDPNTAAVAVGTAPEKPRKEPVVVPPASAAGLSQEFKTALDQAVKEQGASSVIQHIVDGTNDLAMSYLSEQNRKGVLFAMKVQQVAQRTANVLKKAEFRLEAGEDDEADADADDATAE